MGFYYREISSQCEECWQITHGCQAYLPVGVGDTCSSLSTEDVLP